MASTCSQILGRIQAAIEAIDVGADKAHAGDNFTGWIGQLPMQAGDRVFALAPQWPDRSERYVVSPQTHRCEVDLTVGYALTNEAWSRAADDAALVTEALWGCIYATTDLQLLTMQPGSILVVGERLVATRRIMIEWTFADG